MTNSRLLLVEPNTSIRVAIEQTCLPLVGLIDTASSFDEAQKLLANQTYDLCITPVGLRDSLGFRFYELCLSSKPEIKLILRCEIPEVMDAIKATREGAFAFFPWNGPSTQFSHLVTAALNTEKRNAEASWRKRMVHRSGNIALILDEIEHLSGSDSAVHISGPSGSGKKLTAELIHEISKRRDGGFVYIDCRNAVAEQLSALLFGHTTGAFEGANQCESGALVNAEHGVLFLHHIDALPMSVQLQLLSALEQKAVRPLGSDQFFTTDFRLITSSDRKLESELNTGNFSEALYTKIYAVELRLPALADRAEDIPLLAKSHVEKVQRRRGAVLKGFSKAALQLLAQASWPGNVRQLFYTIDKIILKHSNLKQITEQEVASVLEMLPRAIPTYAEAKARFERQYLIQLMILTDGNVAQAARMASRNRTDFYKLLSRNHLDAASFKPNLAKAPRLQVSSVSVKRANVG